MAQLKAAPFGALRLQPQAAPGLEVMLASRDCLADEALIEALTIWRAEHADAFPSVFRPTVARTHRWLDQLVLAQPGRALFVIREHGRLAGHVGLSECSDSARSAEITDVLKGRPDLQKGAMRQALMALLLWLYGAGLKTIRIGSFLDNLAAIRLYHSLRFVPDALVPLVVQPGGDAGEYRWIPASAGQRPERFLLNMHHEQSTQA